MRDLCCREVFLKVVHEAEGLVCNIHCGTQFGVMPSHIIQHVLRVEGDGINAGAHAGAFGSITVVEWGCFEEVREGRGDAVFVLYYL